MSNHAEHDPHHELWQLSQRLLDSIDAGDWTAYADLCDTSLTAFEPEAIGHLVAGMDFHRYYFEIARSGRPQQSTISAPDLRVMGDVAVVCYVRLIQRQSPDGSFATAAFEETRIWERQDGQWQHVHFHRAVPANTLR